MNSATNKALEEVTSEWICCSAADDWLEPRFIERMSQAASLSPTQGIITSQYVEWFEEVDVKVHHDHRSDLGTWYLRDPVKAFSSSEFEALLGTGYVALQLTASILRTKSLRDLGGIDPDMKWHSDWYAANVLALRHGFTAIAEPLAVFRRATETFSGAYVRNHAVQQRLFADFFDRLRADTHQEFRRHALRRPAVFAPFMRDVLPVLARRGKDRDLFLAVVRWWLGQVLRARRPGPLLRLRQRIGFSIAPKM